MNIKAFAAERLAHKLKAFAAEAQRAQRKAKAN